MPASGDCKLTICFAKRSKRSSKHLVAMTIVETVVGLAMVSTMSGEKTLRAAMQQNSTGR